MQKCLNDDTTYFSNKFKKHPWILILIVFLILSGISLFTVSLLCNIKFQCSDQQQQYSLFFGLNICLITFVFIIIPWAIRSCLNCIYYNTIQEATLPVSTRSPISSRPRSRSNSREKTPPSPQLRPIPKHASKSFKEYHSEA